MHTKSTAAMQGIIQDKILKINPTIANNDVEG